MKQKTIGLNPLEEYLSKGKEKKDSSSSIAEPAVQQENEAELGLFAPPVLSSGAEHAPLAGKQRITLHISADIVDRVKNAVYWEPGLTIASFAEEALEKALLEIEAQRGSPFPQRREHRLRGGRPMI